MATAISPLIDGTDPAVVALTWGLTQLAGLAGDRISEKTRHALPALAVVIAVGLRAGYTAVQGEPLTVDVFARGLAAGAVAVFLHSQVREVRKVRKRRRRG